MHYQSIIISSLAAWPDTNCAAELVGYVIEFIAQTQCLLCLMFKGSIPLVPPPI